MAKMQASKDILGKWQMVESDANFDKFLSALGVSYLVRKLGAQSKPLVTISVNDAGQYTFKQESLVKTSSISFHLNEPFDETTADGRKCKSLMYLDKPNVMIHKMGGTSGGKDSICAREFAKDKLVVTCQVDDIVTVRKYDRVQ